MEEQLKQAKLKALRLLTDIDRTEAELREKLKGKGFSEEIIHQAIEYVNSFGYLDDSRYARRFVESKKDSKSRYELMGTLLQKGIEKEIILGVLEECYPREDERMTILHLIEKQHFSIENSTAEEKKKLCARFLRKGFHYEDIQKIIEVSSWNA